MTHSAEQTKRTAEFEGVKLSAYQDSVGVWTIGVGHTANVHKGDTCTMEQAMDWLDYDLSVADCAVNKLITVPLNQNQHDALADFVFNLGEGSLAHSTLLKVLNAGDYDGAANQILAWDHAGGKVLQGLTKRRIAERALFLEAV
jgi:lysozyme